MLVATIQWPTFVDCDGATEVAILRGGVGPEKVVPSDRDSRKAIIAAGGSSWGLGHLGILLTVPGDSVLSVIDIEQVVFRHTTAEPLWMFTPQGGCGDIYTRLFKLDLDANRLVDAGVYGGGESSAGVRSAPLGRAFTVSRTDPARIMVDARSCMGAYEWGLLITYVTAGGSEHRLEIGSPQHPFRSAGARSKTIPAYTFGGGEEGLSRVGSATKPFNC